MPARATTDQCAEITDPGGERIAEQPARRHRDGEQDIAQPCLVSRKKTLLDDEVLAYKRMVHGQTLAHALYKGPRACNKGIVNIVGCNNPRVVYERAVVDVAEELLKNDILLFTNGCASFPLLKLGFCSKDGAVKAGDSLQKFLSGKLPPVWHMGECVDNTRASVVLGGIAQAAGHDIKDMPYGFASPEWSNEKGLDASLAFRLFGINSYHCVEPPVQGSTNVENFLKHDTKETLG